MLHTRSRVQDDLRNLLQLRGSIPVSNASLFHLQPRSGLSYCHRPPGDRIRGVCLVSKDGQ